MMKSTYRGVILLYGLFFLVLIWPYWLGGYVIAPHRQFSDVPLHGCVSKIRISWAFMRVQSHLAGEEKQGLYQEGNSGAECHQEVSIKDIRFNILYINMLHG